MNVQGGQLIQSTGNPALPGSLVTGPLLAGNIQSSDGTTNLAGVGSMAGGLSNVGFSTMTQADDITQATNGSVAGVFLDPDNHSSAKPCFAHRAAGWHGVERRCRDVGYWRHDFGDIVHACGGRQRQCSGMDLVHARFRRNAGR